MGRSASMIKRKRTNDVKFEQAIMASRKADAVAFEILSPMSPRQASICTYGEEARFTRRMSCAVMRKD